MDPRPNPNVPRPGRATRESSISMPAVSNTSEPTTTEHRFLFVDTQDDVSQVFGVGREKMAFLSKLAHQRRKKESIARLRSTQRTKSQQTAATQENPTQQQQEGLRQALRRQGSRVLTGYLGQGYVDPFDTSSVVMTDAMNMYFHHFRVQLAPTAVPFDGAWEGSLWAQRSATIPALRYIGLFLAAGNKALLETSHGVAQSVNSQTSRDAIRLRIEAIKALNSLLRHPNSAVAQSTMLCVSNMRHCEALHAQFTAIEAHIKGLDTLINLGGGLESMEHTILSVIYQGDISCAALKDSQPCYRILPCFRSKVLHEAEMFRRRSRSYEYGIAIPRSISCSGTRFYKSAWNLELDAELKNALSAASRVFVHFEMGKRFPSLVKPTHNYLSIILLHDLLSLRCLQNNNDLNDPLRRALFVYTYQRIWNFSCFPVTQYIMDGLKESLIPRFTYIQATAPDLLLWILFIGALGSQGYVSHSWFATTLREVAGSLDLVEWPAAESIFVQFFYSDHPGYRRGEDLWKQVMSQSHLDIVPRVSEYISEIPRAK
ncbi:hypothetical protein BJX63DRAFT_416053 [Aspergillus granulosus]|uniref:Uncharacterized protein n=1 Tax=Aspergillus granulosus TaxID=176169 RepID=A0ABR4GTZ6_9EURO